jgi:hypothetical protein
MSDYVIGQSDGVLYPTADILKIQGSKSLEDMLEQSLKNQERILLLLEGLQKRKTPKKAEKVAYTEQFSAFWASYGPRGSKQKAFNYWQRLTKEEQIAAYRSVHWYHMQVPDAQYRKHAERYLRDKCFEAVLEAAVTRQQPNGFTRSEM